MVVYLDGSVVSSPHHCLLPDTNFVYQTNFLKRFQDTPTKLEFLSVTIQGWFPKAETVPKTLFKTIDTLRVLKTHCSKFESTTYQLVASQPLTIAAHHVKQGNVRRCRHYRRDYPD
jgi:hypothetical protein